MSETAPERTPAKGKPGKKILGMDRTTVIVGAVALVGAAAYFLWKRKKSATATTASSSAASSAVDYSGQLSAIQSELESLLGQGSSAVGTGASGSGGGGGTTGYPYGGQTGPSSSAVGTGTTTTPASGGGSSTTPSTPAGGTSGGTTTQPKPAPAPSKPKPGMPTPRITAVTSNSVQLMWSPVPNATSYTTRVTYQGSLVGSPHTSAQNWVNISGLTPNHTYTFHVAASGPGGSSPETNGPAQKTSA